MKLFASILLSSTFFTKPNNAAILGLDPSWPEFIHKTCGNRLGLENDSLPDSAFSASSSHYSTLQFKTWYPHKARLNQNGIINAWVPEWGQNSDPFNESYLQIDFGENNDKIITGINTQGASRYFRDIYTKSYLIEYSVNGITWQTVLNPEAIPRVKSSNAYSYTNLKKSADMNDLIFRGNFDDKTEQFNFMPNLIVARYVRIRPMDWEHVPALRVELFGCDFEPGMPLPNGLNDVFDPESEIKPKK